MPTYTFQSNKTGEIWDDVMSWKELDDYYIKYDCEQIIGTPTTIASDKSLYAQTDDGFKDRMKQIKKDAGPRAFNNPNDKLNI